MSADIVTPFSVFCTWLILLYNYTDKIPAVLASNSNVFGKVIYPDTSQSVIYDPRQKLGTHHFFSWFVFCVVCLLQAEYLYTIVKSQGSSGSVVYNKNSGIGIGVNVELLELLEQNPQINRTLDKMSAKATWAF